MNPYEPDDLDRLWDVVVVGTGMGGSTLGYALARRGYSVLFVEKGSFLLDGPSRAIAGRKPSAADPPEERLRKGQWPREVEGRSGSTELRFHAPLGCGTGGSTNLYASQLERFHPCDFEPRRAHGDPDGSTLPEKWPVRFDELLPYYREAERLFHVRGTEDPLQSDPDGALPQPPPLSERDRDLFESFEELGLHPYRAHAGFKYFHSCDECGGHVCPLGCKADASTVALLPALERHGARLLVECEVERLESTGDRVEAVACRLRGRRVRVRGRRVVLAAGAFMTPRLLLDSTSRDWPQGLANRSGAVGRNLMLHVSDFVIVRPRRALPTRGPRKAIALSDFYTHEGEKLGLFQSVGIEINYGYTLFFLRRRAAEDPRWWRRLVQPFLPLAAAIGTWYYRGAVVFATIVEDRPYWHNRVYASSDALDGRRFEYDYSEELRRRNRIMRRLLTERLGRRHKLRIPAGDNNLNYGHVCGTCRFGDDPRTSVLDRNNRAHDVANLYVVDASFFPSSSGTNVSLTIAANALRVADAICADDRGDRA